jgi:hypothetical protein
MHRLAKPEVASMLDESMAPEGVSDQRQIVTEVGPIS